MLEHNSQPAHTCPKSNCCQVPHIMFPFPCMLAPSSSDISSHQILLPAGYWQRTRQWLSSWDQRCCLVKSQSRQTCPRSPSGSCVRSTSTWAMACPQKPQRTDTEPLTNKAGRCWWWSLQHSVPSVLHSDDRSICHDVHWVCMYKNVNVESKWGSNAVDTCQQDQQSLGCSQCWL